MTVLGRVGLAATWTRALGKRDAWRNPLSSFKIPYHTHEAGSIILSACNKGETLEPSFAKCSPGGAHGIGIPMIVVWQLY